MYLQEDVQQKFDEGPTINTLVLSVLMSPMVVLTVRSLRLKIHVRREGLGYFFVIFDDPLQLIFTQFQLSILEFYDES